MSLNDTLDSVDFGSNPESPVSSQPQIFVTTTRVRNQHLSLAQMRGVISMFNRYFPARTGKRMNSDEAEAFILKAREHWFAADEAAAKVAVETEVKVEEITATEEVVAETEEK